MYLRAAHAEVDAETLHTFIRHNVLGILTTALPSANFPTIQCTHIPWLLDTSPDTEGREGYGKLGRLRGHMARQNPHAKALIEAAQQQVDGAASLSPSSPSSSPSSIQLADEVCVLFNGPADAYVTPKFYTATKPATGKVVPTWNYSAAQVYGRARIYFDAHSDETRAYLQKQVTDLTVYAEDAVVAGLGGDSARPWKVADAPPPYIDLLRKNIIGIEIAIDRLEGKFKMSQEMSADDRTGVIGGFEALQTDRGNEMARTVQARGELKDAKAAATSTA